MTSSIILILKAFLMGVCYVQNFSGHTDTHREVESFLSATCGSVQNKEEK